jgi:hypothetical protein
VRLDVPVDEALLVRSGESGRGLRCQLACPLGRKPADTRELLPHAPPGHVLENDVGPTVLLTLAEDADDIRM